MNKRIYKKEIKGTNKLYIYKRKEKERKWKKKGEESNLFFSPAWRKINISVFQTLSYENFNPPFFQK